jgi:hypothetical protein
MMDNMEVDVHTATPTGSRVATVVLVFTVIAGIVVFLRLFARTILHRVAGLEDACIVLALVCSPKRCARPD